VLLVGEECPGVRIHVGAGSIWHALNARRWAGQVAARSFSQCQLCTGGIHMKDISGMVICIGGVSTLHRYSWSTFPLWIWGWGLWVKCAKWVPVGIS